MKISKVKANAQWAGLTAEQRETLDGWLFEEQVSYDEALDRAKRTLGYTGSVSSLKRYFARRSKERVIEGFAISRDEAATVNGAPGNADAFRAAAMKTLAQLFLRQVKESPGGAKEWGVLAGLLLQSEENDLKRRLKEEENQIRRECLAFAKERFHFDTVEEAMKLLPELKELEQARKDPKLALYEERKRINGIIRRLFGSNPPGGFHPENEEEEAAESERAGQGDEAAREKEWEDRRKLQAANAAARAKETEGQNDANDANDEENE